ncbi:hypothetical protein N7523_004650 [Penicillium sp. IBT 18751x]|nr:hypothetical protein N7523_004650 [Penicillium sp. IBT 18751x]
MNMKTADAITVAARMPNDEDEQDRMDLVRILPLESLHSTIIDANSDTIQGPSHVSSELIILIDTTRWLMLMKGELHEAPIENPQNILDLGTGTGIWALDIAEKFPQAHVIGNDISPIQPNWSLPNVEFIVENIEETWLYKPNHFDFIHARLLAGCIADWPAFIKTIYKHVRPGGYFEIQESAVWAWSDDGSLTADSPLFQYVQALDAAGHAIGRDFNIYHKLRGWLVDAGFEDVQQSTYLLPYSPWPKDPYLKEIGKFQAAQANQAVEAYGLRLLTQVLGWGAEPSRIFQALVKKQLMDRGLHAYVKE